jgi:hypothetical protein
MLDGTEFQRRIVNPRLLSPNNPGEFLQNGPFPAIFQAYYLFYPSQNKPHSEFSTGFSQFE